MKDLFRWNALKSAVALVALAGVAGPVAAQEGENKQAGKQPSASTGSVDRGTVDQIISEWPARPRLAAARTIDKYGLPQEATPERLIWHNNGPWKRTVVLGKEIPHLFPRLHMDYLLQTIDYYVPPDKADKLVAFDGSIMIDRTAGELSTRCDMEEANTLTLNLAHDIVVDKMNFEEARQAFGRIELEFLSGKKPDYMTSLRFKTPPRTADPGKPVIAGWPLPPRSDETRPASDTRGMSDVEILAFVVAIDLIEIQAAADAVRKTKDSQVRQFAQGLHKEHGLNLEKTRKLAQSMGVTPVQTAAVDKLMNEAAANLADLVRLDSDAFSGAYVDQMIKAHQKGLDFIDNRLLKGTRSDLLRAHLEATRSVIAAHLERAKQLQENQNQ